MRRRTLILQTLCVLTFMFSSAVASAMSITLKNGDIVIGEIQQEKIQFQAKAGKLDIKSSEVVSFEEGKLQLRGGTTLVGTFTGGSLSVSTSWGGTISIKTQDITRITQATSSVETSKVGGKTEPPPQPPQLPGPETTPYTPPPPGPESVIKRDDQGRAYIPVRDSAGNIIGYTPSNVTSPSPLKKTIAVAAFENKAELASGALVLITRGLADQLTDALVQSGRFKVLDRQIIESVIAEQDFGASARTTKEGGAAVGGIYRAQILVKGTVTEFDPGTSASGQTFNFYGVNLNSTRAEAHVAVIIYLVDTTTSQIIESQRVEGKAERGGTAWGFQGQKFGFGQAGFKETPLGKATQIVIDRAVEYVSQRLAREPWQGSVAKVEGNTVFINAGSRLGVIAGQEFIACKGTGIVDPVTGTSLGHSLKPIGLVRVSNVVYPDFAEAKLVDGSVPERGDFVVERGVRGVSPYEPPGAKGLQK